MDLHLVLVQTASRRIREFVTTKDYKLYRDGRFYDLKKDPFEDNDAEENR